jgi:hypothetical protein
MWLVSLTFIFHLNFAVCCLLWTTKEMEFGLYLRENILKNWFMQVHTAYEKENWARIEAQIYNRVQKQGISLSDQHWIPRLYWSLNQKPQSGFPGVVQHSITYTDCCMSFHCKAMQAPLEQVSSIYVHH